MAVCIVSHAVPDDLIASLICSRRLAEAAVAATASAPDTAVVWPHHALCKLVCVRGEGVKQCMAPHVGYQD